MVASLDQGGVFRIKVAAPPRKGAANKELLSFLARRLGVKKNDVKIISGAGSRLKAIEINGLDIEEVKSRLQGP